MTDLRRIAERVVTQYETDVAVWREAATNTRPPALMDYIEKAMVRAVEDVQQPCSPPRRPPMSDAPRPNLEKLEKFAKDKRYRAVWLSKEDALTVVSRIRTLEAENATLRRELDAADTSIATLSAGDRYGDGWEAGRDAVVALTRTMQQGFQSRMHEQATFAAIDGALQVLIANTEDLEPSND